MNLTDLTEDELKRMRDFAVAARDFIRLDNDPRMKPWSPEYLRAKLHAITSLEIWEMPPRDKLPPEQRRESESTR